jgi:DNA-binding HxlR family transcriptional regulator
MDDMTIIDLLDEQWRTLPQIRSKITGISGHELTTALRRLAEAGRIEKSAQPTTAPRRGKYRTAGRLAIELFRVKPGESRQ